MEGLIPQGTKEIIETHISRVYLTDKFAYKQKKPVNFGFVDYTTLEKRVFFARRELSLNRRACSGIYLDLIELREKKGRLFIGFKGGKLVDVLVRMRRVKPECFLNNLLKNLKSGNKCNADPPLKILKIIAKKIYLFQKEARTSKRISRFGSYEVYKANWEDNFIFLENKFKDIFKDAEKLFEIYSNFLKSPLFLEFILLRKEGGFIRDVHGDLRMEHIAVLDSSALRGICLMDCVEFDERYRCQDIYLDIAFLLMDFEFNGYFYESVIFFDRYKNCFNYDKYISPFLKYEQSVIPFFKAYRAIVRTKIAMLSPAKSEAEKNQTALKYYKLASFYLALVKKRLVILNCGLSGSGKSSLSDLLSRYFYASVFSSDKIRQGLYGAEDKTVKYSAAANFKVYETMREQGLKEFESVEAKAVIFDATFLKKEHREKIINSFNKKNCIFIFVYSKIYSEKENKNTEEIILKRLAKRFAVGQRHEEVSETFGKDFYVDYSEADADVYFKQKKYFEEPDESEIKPADGGINGLGNALFLQIDASLELEERFNALMKGIVEEFGKNI